MPNQAKERTFVSLQSLDLQTTVPGKCPSSPEDDQEKQRQTDHLIGSSAHAPQHPMVTYTRKVKVGPSPHGLLRHRV
ncbi:hypothetical protein TNCV_3328151 [Trichonephila clavipes]|nr:hypothetical protein TNCV_3328151 [Trichonephila clavipes]